LTDLSTQIKTHGMLVLKGTHGTTISAVQDITRHNLFQKTNDGYAGNGVYFWRDNAYARDLALCWYEYRVRKGDFKENEAAIISVEIHVKENEFLIFRFGNTIDERFFGLFCNGVNQ